MIILERKNLLWITNQSCLAIWVLFLVLNKCPSILTLCQAILNLIRTYNYYACKNVYMYVLCNQYNYFIQYFKHIIYCFQQMYSIFTPKKPVLPNCQSLWRVLLRLLWNLRNVHLEFLSVLTKSVNQVSLICVSYALFLIINVYSFLFVVKEIIDNITYVWTLI